MPKTDPDTDNEEFELELKEFSPLVPKRLAIPTPARTIRSLIPGAAWACAAILVITAPFIVHLVIGDRANGDRPSSQNDTTAHIAAPEPAMPLTFGSAKAMLAGSQPFKEVFDNLAFQSRPAPFANGERSALDELSRERNSL